MQAQCGRELVRRLERELSCATLALNAKREVRARTPLYRELPSAGLMQTQEESGAEPSEWSEAIIILLCVCLSVGEGRGRD